jgi:hypothetical protein
MARITISAEGLRVEPSSRRLRLPMRLFGFPELNIPWDELDLIEAVTGVLPLSNGVLFSVRGRRLIWWCRSSEEAAEVLEQVFRHAPEKIRPNRSRRRVF